MSDNAPLNKLNKFRLKVVNAGHLYSICVKMIQTNYLNKSCRLKTVVTNFAVLYQPSLENIL